MRNICIATWILASLSPAAASADEWSEVASDAGGFSVLMPREPRLTEHAKGIRALLETERMAFLVTTADDPPVEGDAAAKLEQTKQQFLRNASLVSERQLSLGDAAGLEITLDTADTQSIARIYVHPTRNRILVTMVLAKKADKVDAEQATRFFDSFRILDEAE